MTARLAAALAVATATATATAGCTLITDSFLTNEFSGDAYPIDVDTTTGGVIVGLRSPGNTDRTAVLDLLSPFTSIDPGTTLEPQLTYTDVTLLGKAADGTLSQPRARFRDAQLLQLHTCRVPDAADPANAPLCELRPCTIADNNPDPDSLLCSPVAGVDVAPRAFDGVIGADALAGDAVRLRLADDQVFVLPDVGGSDRGRTLDCDALFSSPYRGGGTLVIDGTELPFGGRRIAVQACLGPDPGAPLQDERGTDALLVVSTSIGVSVLGESAYRRYQARHVATARPLELLDSATVVMPSGLISGRHATISAIALVGSTGANALAPCRQIYAHRLLAPAPLPSAICATENPRDCPCEDGSRFCPVPAVLELTPPAPGVDVLVVADTDPTLQALRTELRPDQPEVDGILGAAALRSAEIDVDYPHDRLLARCPNGECCARPALATERDRDQVNACIALQTSCPTASILPAL